MAHLAGLGGLGPRAGLSVKLAEPGAEAVAGTEMGAVTAWSLEGVGAGALTESEVSDFEDMVATGLTCSVATEELALEADG